MYQPKNRENHQISISDFNQSCGFQLDSSNEWVILADRIPWNEMEADYISLFPSRRGRPAIPYRMALAVRIIQKVKKLSDRKLIKELNENPYLQYFMGLPAYIPDVPIKPTVLVDLRKRISVAELMKANEAVIRTLAPTGEHHPEMESKNALDAMSASEGGDNLGTMILDATCSPSNIRYPQDFSLLNEAREKLEEMIDFFHKAYHPWKKPRTYRKIARKAYLELAKSKKRSAKKIRATIRKQLGYVKRDLEYLERYMSAGYAIERKYINSYLTILLLYEQQKYMFDNKTHVVENRIVSISQPYIRPIVRGKAKAPTEFGAKYDVSIDENGYGRLEKISFDPYNESSVFQDAVERYKSRTGHYPKRVLVDQIYRTRDNRSYCKDHGITMSGPKLGRPSGRKSTKEEYQDNVDRNEVERFFSRDKRCFGAGLIMAKLQETALSEIALSVLVTNLFAAPLKTFFVLYFISDEFSEKKVNA